MDAGGGKVLSSGTLFATENIYILLTLFPIIIYVALTGFAIYLVIKVVKFMNEKTKLDRERNEKIDELIKFHKGIKE